MDISSFYVTRTTRLHQCARKKFHGKLEKKLKFFSNFFCYLGFAANSESACNKIVGVQSRTECRPWNVRAQKTGCCSPA
jgi:hypothetical protein